MGRDELKIVRPGEALTIRRQEADANPDLYEAIEVDGAAQGGEP